MKLKFWVQTCSSEAHSWAIDLAHLVRMQTSFLPLSFLSSLCSSSFTPFLSALAFTHLPFLFFLLLSARLECCRSNPKIGSQNIYSLTLLHVPANEFCSGKELFLLSPDQIYPYKKSQPSISDEENSLLYSWLILRTSHFFMLSFWHAKMGRWSSLKKRVF